MSRSKYSAHFTDDYISIIKNGDPELEVVGWNKSEWEEEPEVVFSIANAIKLSYTNPKELLKIVGKDGKNLPYPD